MDRIRCKFRCVETGEVLWGDPKVVAKARLQVVTGGGGAENAQFFASTPIGTIEVGTIHPGLFKVGQEYYVDFIEVGKQEQQS